MVNLTVIDGTRYSALAEPRQSEIQRLEAKLQPATEDEGLAVIRFMFRVLPLPATDEGDEETVLILREAYRIAIQEYPKWALIQARDRFIQGKVETHRSSFCPNPADFGREVARIVDQDREALRRALKERRENESFRSSPGAHQPISPEMRAYKDRVIAQLKATAEDERAILSRKVGPDLTPYHKPREGSVAPMSRPLTPEDVAHLPGAPTCGTMQRIKPPAYSPLGSR